MSDKAFIRLGILFIILTPIAVAPIHNRKVAHRWPDGTLIDGASKDMIEERGWLRSWALPGEGKGRRDLYDCRELRNTLLSADIRPEDIAQYSESYLRWLVKDLEGRPNTLRYDLRCIRLLGVAKNCLKSLDSAKNGGILQVLPEQTTTTQRGTRCNGNN